MSKTPPAFEVLSVSGEGENARYIRIGAAWPAKTGPGFNLQLEALPMNNALLLRPRRSAPAQAAAIEAATPR